MEASGVELLGLLLPTLVLIATRPVYQGIEGLNVLLGKLPANVKKILVVVVAFLLTKLGTFVGMPLPGDLAGLTPETISAVLSALGAMGVHQISGKRLKGT
jgi:hypothetical protein